MHISDVRKLFKEKYLRSENLLFEFLIQDFKKLYGRKGTAMPRGYWKIQYSIVISLLLKVIFRFFIQTYIQSINCHFVLEGLLYILKRCCQSGWKNIIWDKIKKFYNTGTKSKNKFPIQLLTPMWFALGGFSFSL